MTPQQAFEAEFQQVVIVEGGYSDHKSDRGGATRYGITEAVARRHGYTGRMQDMPLSLAKVIYKKDYWDKLSLDAVSQVSLKLAHELFDTGVNCGVGTAGEFLQASLNVFNRQGKDYPDLRIDGQPGPMTVRALETFVKVRGVLGITVMLRALNSLQGAYYVSISENRPANEDFTFGWFANRVVM